MVDFSKYLTCCPTCISEGKTSPLVYEIVSHEIYCYEKPKEHRWTQEEWRIKYANKK